MPFLQAQRSTSSNQELRYGHSIERPAEFGIVVNAPQYRNSRAIFLKQIVMFGDVDMGGGNSCLAENCLGLLAEVTELSAVKLDFCQHDARRKFSRYIASVLYTTRSECAVPGAMLTTFSAALALSTQTMPR